MSEKRYITPDQQGYESIYPQTEDGKYVLPIHQNDESPKTPEQKPKLRMIITEANLSKKESLTIGFWTNELLNVDRTILSVNVNLRDHYFEVINIRTSMNDVMLVTARETGSKLLRYATKDFDIRTLLKLEVRVVTDEKLIKKVQEESRYI